MAKAPHAGARAHVRFLLVVGGLLSAALVSALVVDEARPAREASGLIAFARPSGIYVMRTDGSRVHRILRHRMLILDGGLAWSRDGRKLAFADGKAIWSMDADGRHLVAVVPGGSPASTAQAELTGVSSPTWSPDGRRIAFVGYREDEHGMDVWVVDSDGGNLQRLARTPDRYETEVDWSPNGLRLAIEDWWGGGYVPKVYVTDLAGSIVRTLAPVRSFGAIDPAWGPGGRRIAFTRWHGNNWEAELYVVDVGRPAYRRLTHNIENDLSPTWSPDGSKIAFVRTDGPSVGPDSEIYVINGDGTALRRLTHNQVADASPAWQPVAAP